MIWHDMIWYANDCLFVFTSTVISNYVMCVDQPSTLIVTLRYSISNNQRLQVWYDTIREWLFVCFHINYRNMYDHDHTLIFRLIYVYHILVCDASYTCWPWPNLTLTLLHPFPPINLLLLHRFFFYYQRCILMSMCCIIYMLTLI